MLIWRKIWAPRGNWPPLALGDPDRDRSRFPALAGGQYRPWMTPRKPAGESGIIRATARAASAA